jgi:hypothetical protein
MKTFEEWVSETDPQLEENWKKWLAGAALAGSLAGGGYYAGHSAAQHDPKAIHSQKATSPDAAQFLGQGQKQSRLTKPVRNTNSQKATSPDAAEFLR